MDIIIRPNEVFTVWDELETLILAPPGLNREARQRTLEYLWTWCRCGVYVRIAEGRLVSFIPFANPNFINNWGLRELLPANREDWPAEAIALGALEPEKWWCNAGVLCTQVFDPDEIWSTTLFPEFAALFANAAWWVPPQVDVEVFLNKRDFPNVRHDGKDPYGATFFGKLEQVVAPSSLLPPPSSVVESVHLLPVLSCFVGPDFADVPIPLAQDHAREDWYPLWASKEEFERDWALRAPRAIFRGSATGCGCSSQLNPRLALLEMTASDTTHFDVRITGRNQRIRKHPNEQALRCLPRAQHRERDDWLTMDQQRVRCRFAICIEGHSATGRLAELLRNGFLVFLIKTVVAPANTLFYTDWLVEGRHVVRCRLEELPRLVRRYASYAHSRAATDIAWEATRFHARWLVPTELEKQLGRTLIHIAASTE